MKKSPEEIRTELEQDEHRDEWGLIGFCLLVSCALVLIMGWAIR